MPVTDTQYFRSRSSPLDFSSLMLKGHILSGEKISNFQKEFLNVIALNQYSHLEGTILRKESGL